MPIRVGVNALYLIPGGVGGTEIYLRNLLAALAQIDAINAYSVLTNRETADLTPAAPNFRQIPTPVRARIRPYRILWEQIVLPFAASEFDVLLNPGFTAPLIAPCPQVTVFHDLQHKRHPEYFRWFDLPFWRALLWASARRSSRLIAVSEATRRDLLECYRVDSRVVPHGVERAFFEMASQRQPEPIILCVSTLHPHKGIEALVKAFGAFHARHPEFRLVLAGMRGFHAQAIERTIAALDLQRCVRITGWVERDELYGLYRRAWAFVYPSRFEGFGMPVAEAMAAGIPTACSSIDPLRELAGEAALLFDPADERAVEAALERIATDQDLRARLQFEGPRRASALSWQASARATLEVLEDAVRAPERSTTSVSR
jgi:glycosyltransferase involved in cell wall biosynthesis